MTKPLPPEKSEFFDLLNRAVQSDDPSIRKNKKSGQYFLQGSLKLNPRPRYSIRFLRLGDIKLKTRNFGYW